MPALSIPRAVDLPRDPGLAVAALDADSILTARYDSMTEHLTVTAGTSFVLHITRNAAGDGWDGFQAEVQPNVSNLTVARINRLLSGYGVPSIEWYHRTKTVVMRVPGRAVDLPVRVTGHIEPGEGYRWWVNSPADGTLLADSTGTRRPSPAPVVRAPSVRPPVRATHAPTGPVVAPPPALGSRVPLTGPAPVHATTASSLENAIAREREALASLPPYVPPVPEDDDEVIVVAPTKSGDRDPLGIFTFPTPSAMGSVEVSAETASIIGAVWAQHIAGERQVMALFGPTGTGKTSLVYDLAAAKGVGVFQFDAAGATTFIDWVGATAVVERNGAPVTEWQPSAFIEAIRADGLYAGRPRIILVDELTRSESAAATNFLMTVTHGIAGVYIPDARRTVPIDPTALIVYTGNIGSAYNATVPLDPALIDRVAVTVWLDYPDEATEVRILRVKVPTLDPDIARKMVTAVRNTRGVADRGEIVSGVSTRRLIVAAGKVAFGMTPLQAAQVCWVNTYSAEGGNTSERSIVLNTIEGVLRGV